jgi:hypothetical protein
MKTRTNRYTKLVLTFASASCLYSGQALAQNEVLPIDDLRAQLTASAKEGKQLPLEQFAMLETETEAENKKLRDEEAEILRQLQPEASQRPVVSKGFVDQGRMLADDSALVATSAGSADVAKIQDAFEVAEEHVEIAPVVPDVSRKELESLKSSNTQLNRKLNQTQTKLTESEKKLKEAKDRLMMAEAEVQRLSQILDRRGMDGLSRSRPPAAVASQPAVRAVANAPTRASEDLPIATVIVDKANLRTGPGTENSALMSVSKGTRLVVETRNGSWYRVFAPNGARAWVTGDVLSFTNPNSAPAGVGTALRVRAYDASAEKESNRLLGRALN